MCLCARTWGTRLHGRLKARGKALELMMGGEEASGSRPHRGARRVPVPHVPAVPGGDSEGEELAFPSGSLRRSVGARCVGKDRLPCPVL